MTTAKVVPSGLKEPLLTSSGPDAVGSHDVAIGLAPTKDLSPSISAYTTNSVKPWVFALVSIFAAILYLVLLGVLGRPFNTPMSDGRPQCIVDGDDRPTTVLEYSGCLSPSQFWALLGLCVLTPLIMWPIGAWAQRTASRYPAQNGTAADISSLFGMASALSAVVSVATWVCLLKPWYIIPQTDSEGKSTGKGGYNGHGWEHYGVFLIYFGGWLTVLFTGLAVMFAVAARNFGGTSLKPRPPVAVQPLEDGGSRKSVVVLGLVMFGAFLSTACFASVINYVPQHWNSVSEYSMLNIHIGKHFVTHFYGDCVNLYLVILLVSLVGLTAQYGFRQLSSKLHHRLKLPWPANIPSWTHPFPHGITVGEVLVLTVVLYLYSFELWFWTSSGRGEYLRQEAHKDGASNPALQIGARVWGHFANLSFSLLLFPAARNSMWVHVFGMPFERAIQYHRILGAVAYISVTVHMLLWFIKWFDEGNLGFNIFAINELRISNITLTYTTNPKNKSCTAGPTVSCTCVHDTVVNGTLIPGWTCAQGVFAHWDNPTVPMNVAAWVGLTFMVFTAWFSRRANYELFHYVHHFAWAYYVVALIHANSFWYYAIGGLTLYLVDRLTRLYNGIATPALATIEQCDGGITAVWLDDRKIQYFAGQYAWLNVPVLSQHEWHPFTISSAPSSASVSFHIKDMGPGTFTNRLNTLAGRCSSTEIRVDAAYGRPGRFGNRECVLLLAGGIGVTPMHSILAELHARAMASLPIPRRVHFVWTAADDGVLCLFPELFLAINNANPNSVFRLSLHNSRKPKPAVDGASDAVLHTRGLIHRSRPDLPALFHELRDEFADVGVMVCGPAPLIDQASNLSFEHGFEFHTEIFGW